MKINKSRLKRIIKEEVLKENVVEFTKERDLLRLLNTLKDFTMSRRPGSEAVIAQINRLLKGSTIRDHQNILKTINAGFEYAVTAPKNGRALEYLNRVIGITQGNMEGIMARQGRRMIDKYKPGLDAGDKASRQFQKDLPDKMNKMRRETEDLIKATKNAPKKPGVFKKLISRLPGIGKIFIAGGVLLAADEAFAADGLSGVAKVLADNAVNLTPVVGDVKGIIDILGSAGASAGAEMERITGGDVQMFEKKITKSKLKQIIKEELACVLSEGGAMGHHSPETSEDPDSNADDAAELKAGIDLAGFELTKDRGYYFIVDKESGERVLGPFMTEKEAGTRAMRSDTRSEFEASQDVLSKLGGPRGPRGRNEYTWDKTAAAFAKAGKTDYEGSENPFRKK